MYVAPYLDDFDFWHLYFQTELPSNPTSKRIKTISCFSWRKYRGNWCKIVESLLPNWECLRVQTWKLRKSKLEIVKNSKLFVAKTWIEFIKFKIFKNRCMFWAKVRILSDDRYQNSNVWKSSVKSRRVGLFFESNCQSVRIEVCALHQFMGNLKISDDTDQNSISIHKLKKYWSQKWRDHFPTCASQSQTRFVWLAYGS